MGTKLGRLITCFDGLLPLKSHKPWSRDKLKSLCFYYHRTYSHHSWQNGNLPWCTPAYKVTWAFDHVVLRDHVRKWNHYISSIKAPMATKLGRMVTYLDFLLLIKSHDPLIMWSCKIMWKLKSFYLHYHSAYGHRTWQDGNLSWWALACKVTWQTKIIISPLPQSLWPPNLVKR